MIENFKTYSNKKTKYALLIGNTTFFCLLT